MFCESIKIEFNHKFWSSDSGVLFVPTCFNEKDRDRNEIKGCNKSLNMNSVAAQRKFKHKTSVSIKYSDICLSS